MLELEEERMSISGKRKIILLSVLTVVMVFFGCLSLPNRTFASEYPTISTMDDFYEYLSKQIYAHEGVKNYTIASRSLVDSIMDFSYEEYMEHYMPESPMISGCYLGYYVSSIYFSYRHNTLKMTIIFPYSAKEMNTHFDKIAELSETLRGETDFDTVLNVHDYLLENFEYDPLKEKGNHTDIEGFRDGVMVCTGYSLAAYAILNEAGIPTRVITGYGGPGNGIDNNHMWNMVELDGRWYNMDATWDDGGRTKQYTYFLKSDADFPEHIRLGSYNNQGYTSSVSKTSYKLPAKLRYNKKTRIYFGSMIILIICGIIQIIQMKKKAKNAPVIILSEEPIPGIDDQDPPQYY